MADAPCCFFPKKTVARWRRISSDNQTAMRMSHEDLEPNLFVVHDRGGEMPIYLYIGAFDINAEFLAVCSLCADQDF